MRLRISHNMEIAHRLSLQPGKCQQIHGHGMQVTLTLLVEEGEDGMAINSAHQPMEFGHMKKMFRDHIDKTYDHHLILNNDDPWARALVGFEDINFVDDNVDSPSVWNGATLPGLVTVPGDPTTENLCKWIAEWACNNYRVDVICTIEETRTNGAEVAFHWNSFGASPIRGAI